MENVGNRLYISFGTASRLGPLLPFVERNKSNCLASNGKVADSRRHLAGTDCVRVNIISCETPPQSSR